MPRELRGSRSVREILFADGAFYRMVMVILIPIVIQNAITNFVNLLDNAMVGQVGTEQMSGVAIANQLFFVFNLCVFGGLAGAGIFAAQFHGAGNREGVRQCFRYKFCLAVVLVFGSALVYTLSGEGLVSRFLHDDSASGRVEATLGYGLDYLRIMLWGLAPFALTQVYASTLRETGETRLPMIAGIAAVFVNLIFNYLLIFGHLGLPRLGVRGAAIATVISRFVELSIVVAGSHCRADRYPFVSGLYSSFRISAKLARDISLKGLPLLANEALWAIGQATLAQCHSMRGLDVVAAMNISSTVSNLFAVSIFSTGNATAIIVGQTLGSNDLEKARRQAWHLIVFGILISLGTALLMLPVAPLIPGIYRTSDAVRSLATQFLRIFALCMPIFAYANCCYFILRSGGKTLLTFVFDSVFSWCVCVPLAWTLVHLTGMDSVKIYLCVQLSETIKCALGHVFLSKGIWLNNIVAKEQAE